MSTNAYRFPNEETWLAAANAEGLIAGDGTMVAYSHDHAIDVIGVLYERDSAVYDDEGEMVAPPVPLPGWHVNTQGIAPEDWDQYLVYPYRPQVAWSGLDGPVPP